MCLRGRLGPLRGANRFPELPEPPAQMVVGWTDSAKQASSQKFTVVQGIFGRPVIPDDPFRLSADKLHPHGGIRAWLKPAGGTRLVHLFVMFHKADDTVYVLNEKIGVLFLVLLAVDENPACCRSSENVFFWVFRRCRGWRQHHPRRRRDHPSDHQDGVL